MDDLISRKTAVESLLRSTVRVSGLRIGKTILAEYANQCRDSMIDVIRNVPAADAAPVIHAAWIYIGKTKKGSRIIKCSHCGRERKGGIMSLYCMDCGAKMDGTYVSDEAREAIMKLGENVHPFVLSEEESEEMKQWPKKNPYL